MKALIVVGLGYGDEGKGSIVEYLADKHNSSLVVRFNGGPQAAHNVVDNDGTHHTFSQFGSASLLGAHTFLSQQVYVDPGALLNEAEHLDELGCAAPFRRLWVHKKCPLITPYHKVINQLKEVHGKHGSCGIGYGEAVADILKYGHYVVPVVADLRHPGRLREKLHALRERKLPIIQDLLLKEAREKLDEAHLIDKIMNRWEPFLGPEGCLQIVDSEFLPSRTDEHPVIFEGAQGALLHEGYGWAPHVTWSDPSAVNAHHILNDAEFEGRREVIGVTRTYHTRHGAGPFVSEVKEPIYVDKHNGDDGWQGYFRTGLLDLVALRYGVAVSRCDQIAMTHMDVVTADLRVVSSYDVPAEHHHHFDRSGKTAGFDQIKFHTGMNFLEQEPLTRAMFAAKPIITNAAAHLSETRVRERAMGWFEDALIEAVEQEVGRKVTLASWGPTRRDKRVIL